MLKISPPISRCIMNHLKADNLSQIQRQKNVSGLSIIFCRFFGQPVAKTHPHLINNGEVTPGVSKTEFQTRRTMLVQKAINIYKEVKSVKTHIFIIPAASKVYMSNDIPYPFRQNTDFLYLCGFQEPDSVLVLKSGTDISGSNHTSCLFLPEKDPFKELWDGPRSGTEGGLELTGVDCTFNVSEFEKYLNEFCRLNSGFVLWYNFLRPTNSVFHSSVVQEFMVDSKYRSLEDPSRICQQLRVIKSPAEVKLMEESVEIASQAFVEVMKFSHPRVNESALYAKMDFECRMREAEFLAYPPVVAGGQRANIIHYINNNQLIEDGELVLMDAGCEYHGYTSDITRTWPVSGKFSPAQKKLYNALLSVQLSCIELCTTKFSLDQVYHGMLNMIGQQLQALGLISPELETNKLMQKAKEFCPHHVSHYLGMDVHDTGEISRSTNLQPGMIVTVEPGIYINATNTEVPEEYRGIGIRIEDDVLITESKPIVLSANCPKTVEDIESIMSER